mmetsp:Transcript_37446/g.116452  ORF Transcript_37446/g.116452 Transcript_37446/m.116452 type:complete len:210 (-) Transcript_37446:172-801(-)
MNVSGTRRAKVAWEIINLVEKFLFISSSRLGISDSSPTMPYFIRLSKPMLPTNERPVCTPARMLNSGRPRSASHLLMTESCSSIQMAALTARVGCSSLTTGLPKMPRIASPINSMTMPPYSSMIMDMSWKYRLRRSRDLSGGRFSTIVVKEAMSEKNTVTSASCTSMLTSASWRKMCCTTCQGTYLPQDLMAFFMFSKVLRIIRSSLTP